MSFPFYIYFLSFPSPSFSSEHTKPEALWNLHRWLILGMGFWPKNTSSNLGLYWSSSLSFSLCVSHSLLTYPHSLLFSFSSHSVCLHDFSTFLGFATTHSPTLFLFIFGVFATYAKLNGSWSCLRVKILHWALSGELKHKSEQRALK